MKAVSTNTSVKTPTAKYLDRIVVPFLRSKLSEGAGKTKLWRLAMMGRVSSSFMLLISLAQVLGLLLSGFLAQIMGVRLLFAASATLLALISGAGYLWIRDKGPVATSGG